MKLVITGIILAVIILVVIVAGGINFFSSFSFSKLLPENQPPAPSPSPTPIPTPNPSSLTPPPTQPPPPALTTTPAPPPTATPPAPGVNFEIAIANISGSGLSRTVTADISNTGTQDAHNVWLKLEVSSKQTRIQLDGQDFLSVDVGTLPSKASVTKQATLTLSITDGLKIMMNGGADFTLTINSTERTQTMSQFYKP